MSTNVINQVVKNSDNTQIVKMVVRSNERGPQGEQGEQGSAATIAAGNVYTIDYGQAPSVINTGTSSDAEFNFYIPEGKPGAVHYTAGPGIEISDDNKISATGGTAATWGVINGNINNQTDLVNVLNTKQTKLTAGSGLTISGSNISANTFTNSAVGVIKGSDADGKVHAENDGTGSVNGWSTMESRVDAINDKLIVVGDVISEPETVQFVDTVNIIDRAVTADKINLATLGGNYNTVETDTRYTWIDGKHIYKKTISFGALPDTTAKTVSHSISNIETVIKTDAFTSDGTNTLPVPSAGSSNISLVITSSDIIISTFSDRTSYVNTYVTIYYTKTS